MPRGPSSTQPERLALLEAREGGTRPPQKTGGTRTERWPAGSEGSLNAVPGPPQPQKDAEAGVPPLPAGKGSPRWSWLWWLLPVVAAWAWFCTLENAALERVQTLRVVEPYSFAVFDQLVWNYAHTGRFSQTIHFGYADSWMWSGHRSPWLFAVAWLYGLDPQPLTLCRLQIAAVALGALPAFGLGWRALGGPLGGVAALVLFLGYPPLMLIALNDYQDVILGIPFAVAAVHQAWRGSTWGYLAALLGAAAAREEWVLVLPFLGLMAPGPWRRRLAWAGKGLALAALYSAALWSVGKGYQGHDNPMVSHFSGWLREGGPARAWQALFGGGQDAPAPLPSAAGSSPGATGTSWLGGFQLTRSWPDVVGFYLPFLLPVHLVAILAPTALIPAAGALLVHLSAPLNAGVDTDWRGHIHHMAPVATLVVLATLLALGFCYRRTQRFRVLWATLAVAAVLMTVQTDLDWARRWGLHLSFLPARQGPQAPVPEWALVASLPPRAVIATDTRASLVVSSRPLSYTYNESLEEKSGGMGLRAVGYLLVRKEHGDWVRRAREAKATKVGETPDYLLYRLPWAASTDPAKVR